eukprot:CAMPEP_0197465092 /NCGR_PEP_ID=MMETSP1175-20131217/64358_1 /TAXON_ID=1003142 /ORGANISM="Triceratium dubium, Strain CCMP147" /LENGTH=720 /DNA_ID=CAMNT_0043001097 /DNA_START=208 /DNA_END=2370 /DNA_ORIENTATION=-
MSGFDPASRYDPSSMGRIADDEIDPEAELFDHAENAANSSGMLGFGGLTGSLGRVGKSVPHITIDKRTAKKAMLGLAVVGCIVGASVGISVAMRNSDSGGGGGGGGAEVQEASGGGGSSGGGNEGGGGAGRTPNSQGIAQFVPPPDDLAMKCAPLTVSVKSGWDDCKSLCRAAECCFLPEGHWYSCRAENEEDCSAYEYGCATLDHVENLRDDSGVLTDDGTGGNNGGVAPAAGAARTITLLDAPTDIGAICSETSLSTREGHNACEELCDRKLCCDEPDEECTVNNEDACGGYEEPCIAYSNAHDDVLDEAAVKCNTETLSTPEGVQNCKEYCSGAMDCFDGDARFADGWCEQYGPCHALTTLSGEQGFASAAEAIDAVDEACGTDFATCKNMCHAAECCFGGTVNNEDACGGYEEPCIAYSNAHDDVLDEAAIKCNTETLSTAEGVRACKEYCAAAMDCFDGGDARFADGWCEQYGPCHALTALSGDEGFASAAEAIDAVDEACGTDFATCKNMCHAAECCFGGEGGTSACEEASGTASLDCSHYGACKILFSAEDGGGEGEGEGEDDGDSDVTVAVQKACNDDNLATVDGFQECHDLCSPYLCCFSTNEAENCYDENNACDLYKECERAYETDSQKEDYSKELVERACSDAAIGTEEGLAECRSVCSPFMCCVLPESMQSNCVDTYGEEKCAVFASCAKLTSAEDDVYEGEEDGGGL